MNLQHKLSLGPFRLFGQIAERISPRLNLGRIILSQLCLLAIGSSEAIASPSAQDSHNPPERVRYLRDVVVEGRRRNVLHILALVRDYSTLATYTDTVVQYREKWVDFMLPTKDNKNFKGWRTPRILTTKSFYQFKNGNGLDSVSDRFNQNFSWVDWVGVLDRVALPEMLVDNQQASDTIFGKYSPAEIWKRIDDDVRVKIDVLADTLCHRWAPNFKNFFSNDLDFDMFKIDYDFRDIYANEVRARDLWNIRCHIESRGRGTDMARFFHLNEPYFVTTDAEIYIIDRQYITNGEAKKWGPKTLEKYGVEQLVANALLPPLTPDVALLVDRVNGIDHVETRLKTEIDPRLSAHIDYVPMTGVLTDEEIAEMGGKRVVRVPINTKQKILKKLLGMLGFSY